MSAAYVFDAYGTLFDVHSAVFAARDEIGPAAAELSALWRGKQLEYTWVYSMLGRPASFRSLTAAALDFAMAAQRIEGAELRGKLLDAYDRLAAYAEAPAVLQALRGRRKRLAILSNGDPDMLQSALRSAALGVTMDVVLSVAESGVFKPSGRVYRQASQKLGLDRGAITFVSANRWDVAGARAFGFSTAWINRTGAPDEYRDLPAHRTHADLRGILETE